MVDPGKVRLMTQAAIFETKEKNGVLRTVTFRRKDYILYHMLAVMLSATTAYLAFVALMFFMIIMAYEEIVLNVGEMIVILIGVVIGYVLVLTAYYVISHKYFGEKHVRARKDIVRYLSVLHALDPSYETPELEES